MWFFIPIGIVVYLLIGCFVAAIVCRVTDRPWKMEGPDNSLIPVIMAWPLVCMLGMIFGSLIGLEKVGKFIAINIMGVPPENIPHNISNLSLHPESTSKSEFAVIIPEKIEKSQSSVEVTDRFKLIDMEE